MGGNLQWDSNKNPKERSGGKDRINTHDLSHLMQQGCRERDGGRDGGREAAVDDAGAAKGCYKMMLDNPSS